MKANEFVKKHGWTAVIAAVKSTTAEETAAFESKDIEFLDKENPMLGVNIKVHAIPYLAVKKYIDAYELVEIHGYEQSKEIVKNAPSNDHFYSWTLGGSGVRDKTVNIGELRKAIADVEACKRLEGL